MIRFIHAADLHLDSPFKGLKALPEFIWQSIYHSTFQSLKNIVNLAIEQNVDFVCLAGDIYDAEDRSVKAQAYLRKEMNRLYEAAIPVFLIHGNHDFLDDNGLQLDMPENVYIFGPEIETKKITTKHQENVAVTGFSYAERWVRERKIKEYPIRSEEADYHIGLLHGFQEGNGSGHHQYAPFSLSELKSRQYDYWALGHIHKKQILSQSPFIIYPGNTQGRNRNENGAKGCYLVELSDGKQDVVFYATAPIEWREQNCSLKGKQTLQEVYTELKRIIEEQRETNKSVLLSVVFEQTDDLMEGVLKKIQSGDLLEGIQQPPQAAPFVWIVRLDTKRKEETILPAITKLFPEEWQLTLAEALQIETFNKITQSFYEQQPIGKILDTKDEQYREKIVQRAEKELKQQLGHEGWDLG